MKARAMTNDDESALDVQAAIDNKFGPDAIEKKIKQKDCPYQRVLRRLGTPNVEWEVDAFSETYGREALKAAAEAGARAAHFHRRELDSVARDHRLRRALVDALDACRRIVAEAGLCKAAAPANALSKAALIMLEAPALGNRDSGSPGRGAQAAAAEAAAQVWSRAEARRIPRSGKVADDHSLQMLLRSISADLFGRRGMLTVSVLRKKSTPKK